MNSEPIVILGSPRSGTSLVASIFAAHGVWAGTSREADQANPHGYFENIMLTEYRAFVNYGEGMERDSVLQLIEADGYRGGPWLVKHSPFSWRAWRNFEPRYVTVRRPQRTSVQSRIRCGHWDMTDAEHRIAVMADNAILDGLERHMGAAGVWPDAFFKGYWSTMEAAFVHCGLEFDRDRAESCLDPSIWSKS